MSIADALEAVGIHQRDVAFDKAIALAIEQLIASGGTNEGALMRLQWIVERMSGMGHVHRAQTSQVIAAQTRQPVEDGGARPLVPQGQNNRAPSSSSDRGGEGQKIDAHQGRHTIALPVRERALAQRSSDANVAKMLAISVMDTLKIDGLAVGKWSVARARVEGVRKTREGYILRTAAGKVANAPGHALLEDVVKISEMQTIIQKAAEVSDVI